MLLYFLTYLVVIMTRYLSFYMFYRAGASKQISRICRGEFLARGVGYKNGYVG